MSRLLVLAGLAAVIALGIGFAVVNKGNAATIGLGFLTLRQVPVAFVAFGGMVLGMGVVLAAGIHADLRVRRLLRERHMNAGEGESLLE